MSGIGNEFHWIIAFCRNGYLYNIDSCTVHLISIIYKDSFFQTQWTFNFPYEKRKPSKVCINTSKTKIILTRDQSCDHKKTV